MNVDFPRPGKPSMNSDGLEMSLARRNQEMGSKHTVAPVCRWCPMGVPIIGVPDPTAHGHSPHTCTVVARYSGGTSTTPAAPPAGPANPFGGMAGPRAARSAASSAVRCRRRVLAAALAAARACRGVGGAGRASRDTVAGAAVGGPVAGSAAPCPVSTRVVVALPGWLGSDGCVTAGLLSFSRLASWRGRRGWWRARVAVPRRRARRRTPRPGSRSRAAPSVGRSRRGCGARRRCGAVGWGRRRWWS